MRSLRHHRNSHPGARHLLVPVMSARQRAIFSSLMVLWIAALAFFWTWWLQAGHVVTPFGMAVNSLMFVWTLFLPGVFFLHLGRMRRSAPGLDLPPVRVAMIVTKAPSEPWEVVCRTLRAMLRQGMPYAYDVWLADEHPSEETMRWCEANGVQVSTRHGRADYHRVAWPRRTRSKEGNLAFFYDHWGYDRYDIVAQLDADHRPAPTYLREIMASFLDPRVGYVAAPSVCDANAGACWAARGRLYKEAVFHGPQQAGGHHALPPVCIGSHYAVRTIAVREIGGIGPELAEDFSTTLLMNAFGWRGVFAHNAEAHGDGPETFGDFVTQEFQWARSLSDVMLRYSHRYWRGLERGAKIKLGFCQLWYPLYALHMLLGALFPVVALITSTPWTNVTLIDFFAHVLVVSAVLLATLWWVRQQGWMRPAGARLISWESILFLMTRWPWVLLGVLQSWAGWILHRRFSFKVTPKATEAATPLSLRLVMPYLLISAICAGTAVVQGHPGRAQGYYYFCLINAATYLGVSAAVIILHLREAGTWSLVQARRLAGGPILGTALVGGLAITAVVQRGDLAVRALLPSGARRTLGDILADLWRRLSSAGPPGAPGWLVLGAGLTLLAVLLVMSAMAQRHAAHPADRPARPRRDVALFATGGLSGLAFVVLAAAWQHGASVSWAGFAAVLACCLALSAASRPRWHPIAEMGPRRPGNTRGDRTDNGTPTPPTLTRQPEATVVDTPEQPLPPPPRPATRRARRRRQRREAGAPSASGTPRPPSSGPSPASVARATLPTPAAVAVPVSAEIDWCADEEDSRFALRLLQGPGALALHELSPKVRWHGPGAPRRTQETSRAHAILYDRLTLAGWKPYGRGDAWYAHRVRRSVVSTDSPNQPNRGDD